MGSVAAAPPAGPEQTVVVLPITMTGKGVEKWRLMFTEALMLGLARGDAEVVGPDVVAPGTTCEDAECRAALVEKLGATHFVQTTISVEERIYDVKLDIIDIRSDAVVSTTAEDCQLCGAEEVAGVVTTQAAVLQQKIEALAAAPPPVFSVVSEPPGAAVLIDGEPVGRTPLEHTVAAGTHKVMVSKAGYESQTRELEAVDGVAETITVELSMPPPKVEPPPNVDVVLPPQRDWRRWGRPLGVSLLASGAAVLATGITFIVLDGRDYQNRCGSDDVDPDGDCRFRFNSTGFGATLAGIGTGATIGGAVVVGLAWGRDRNNVRQRRARLSLRPTGVSLHARF